MYIVLIIYGIYMYVYIYEYVCTCASGGLRASQENRLCKVRSSSPFSGERYLAPTGGRCPVFSTTALQDPGLHSCGATSLLPLLLFWAWPDANPACPLVAWVCS